MAYTESDLTAVRTALAKGERRVQFADRLVEYRSVEELQRVEQAIIRELTVVRRKQVYLVASKGF